MGGVWGASIFSGIWDLNCITSKNRTSCAIDEDPGFSVILTALCHLIEEFFSGQSLSLQEYELLEVGMAMTGGLPQSPAQCQSD